ncbi:acyl-CoA dehydrogenase family protein [Adlercreutzia sp. R7]|uniref:Acyl-CoA dehydrogenase family protein n=1 Tax=Adlercreutzia wanghongyangiae TaxID=3111451 RepID=A0ABU6IKD7_9ACTN|nr:acyl-CoA dehydrogenase family protein [Adlercreutzia sp. R7]
MTTFYYPLNEEQKLILDTVKDFAENDIAPLLPEIDETNAYPWKIYERMGDLGLYHLMLPEELGGGGHGVTTALLIGEEVGKVSPSLGFAVPFSLDAPLNIALCYTKLKDKYFDEALKGKVPIAQAGTDPIGGYNYPEWPVAAVKDGDEWVLNGTRCFATFGAVAKIIVFMGRAEDGNFRYWYMDHTTPGIEVAKVEKKIGWKGQDTTVLNFKDVRVPADQELTFFPDPRDDDRAGIGFGYMGTVAAAVGGMQGVFEKTLEYVKARNTHGEPIGNMSVVGDKMARMATEIEACRCLFHNALRIYDADPMSVPRGLQNMLKAMTTQKFVDIAVQCTDLWGGLGIVEDTGISRYVRDAVNCLAPCRSTDAHYQQIASFLGLGVKYTLSD